MLWIKRNLFLAIGSLLAVLLLVGGLFYYFKARTASAELQEQLNATKAQVEGLYNKDPFPSLTNVDNAKRETDRIRGAAAQAKKFFTPVPADKVTGLAFRTYRDNTLAELQRLAEQANITLPARDYGFSFDAQKRKTEFSDGTFPAIPEQMAEVRALCKILFEAHVNPLVSVKRARVSWDDRDNSTVSDYLGLYISTNEATGAVSSPYEVTFHCLSSELAAVIEGLNKSPHGFLLKAMSVEPAVETPGGPGAPTSPGTPASPNNPPIRRQATPPRTVPNAGTTQPAQPPQRVPGNVPTVAARPGATDRPNIFLKERRLKVTLLIYAIRNAR